MPPSPAQPRASRWSSDFNEVLKKELELVGEEVGADQDLDPDDQLSRAHRKQLVGLAFSGGGIRSATFNLGVLQALAQMKLLREFDYLSTVSGGGYIGSWLMAWIKRRGLKDVETALSPEWVKQPGRKEPEEIHFLRRFSNYLTPKLGWLGADTWTVIATYLRNLILNLIVLIAAMTVLLLLPRIAALVGIWLWQLLSYKWWAAIAILAITFAQLMITRSLRFFRRRRCDERTPGTSAEEYEKQGMIPLLAGSRAELWKDHEGQPITPPVAEAVMESDVWFDEDFDDFFLRAKFSLEATAVSGIRIWQGRTPTDDGGKTASGGHIIHICQSRFDLSGGGSEEHPRLAGAIDGHAPVRPVVLRQQGNVLEIVCQKQDITVTINGETINRRRVIGKDSPGSQRSKPGVIGLARSTGITFDELYVRKLPANFQAGGTQGQIQRWIVAPLFLAAFIGTFAFFFGDVRAPEESIAPKPTLVTAPQPTVTTPKPTVPAPTPRGAQPGQKPVIAAPPRGKSMGERIGHQSPIEPWPWTRCAWITGAVVGGLLLLVRLGLVAFEWLRASWKRENPKRPPSSVFFFIGKEAVSLGAASALGGLGARALYHLFQGRTLWEVTVWGTPALICLSMLVLTLHIGLLGRDLPDEIREWWSRLGAWLLIYSLLWVALFGTAFYASTFFAAVSGLGLSAGWLASTIWGVFAARSASSGDARSSKVREFVAQVAPYVFVVGLFLLLSWAIDWLVPQIAGTRVTTVSTENEPWLSVLGWHWQMMDASSCWHSVGVMTGGALLISAILSWRLDINQFSMHLLYRNRLGRCYLGASNRFRQAQPFTGFATADDFELWELDDLIQTPPAEPDGDNAAGKTSSGDRPNEKRMRAPYLIINAALNLVGGKELAWQQRKAASFVFTQQYCGYEFPDLPPGYTKTREYAASSSRVSLATAMAISGAAASPNMGYHTSPASAFLMTVFNVRLGWWLGNPRQENSWMKSSPGNVLMSLMSELFGLTSDQGRFIYLSDGGHFENLGLYELVRRRCRFIVACDVEEDQSFGFGGLGNAIEKCRSDLGIDLEIDVEPIRRRSEKGYSDWHCAIGHIRYSRVDENGRDGFLVYMKSSLTGDEPTDVLRYAAENPEFPHQTTGDQWFSESQFESYRALGCHVTQNVFGAVDTLEKLSQRTTEELFVDLAQHWHPPSSATKESFSKHTQPVAAIYERLRTNPELEFLNEQIYPEWRVLFADTHGLLAHWRESRRQGQRHSLKELLPKTAPELRAGFYVCNSVLQVMEDVYLDLNLEDEFEHPDNRGWMNFFKHWSWAPMFRVTWTISASNYGTRFQNFCARELNLKVGDVAVAEVELKEGHPRSDDAEQVSRLLAKTIARWLIRQRPLDPETRSHAIATAAETTTRGKKIPEEDAVKMAGDAIVTAVNELLENKAVPKAGAAATEDAEWFTAAILVEKIRGGVGEEDWKKQAAEVAELVIFHGAAIAQRFSTDDIRRRLNRTEQELVELFFVYNPKLVSSSRVLHFSLTPDCPSANARLGEEEIKEDELSFPFGFALLAQIEGKEQMVYFRVQDHLRSMGLASQALEKLIRQEDKGSDMTVYPMNMHPDSHEVPTAEDGRLFCRLFDSAKTAVRQKRARATATGATA